MQPDHESCLQVKFRTNPENLIQTVIIHIITHNQKTIGNTEKHKLFKAVTEQHTLKTEC